MTEAFRFKLTFGVSFGESTNKNKIWKYTHKGDIKYIGLKSLVLINNLI